MSDIEQLHQRINAAMDRVAYGLTQLDNTNSGEADALRAQLDEEKTVNAQLEERVQALKEKQASDHETAVATAQEISGKVETLDLELQKLRETNDKLRQANQALRDANEAGVGEPHLINASVLAELEALRAARGVERAEVEAILSALMPILNSQEGTADA
ncbi:MAG: hypothetical protein ABJL99_07280 [Aliishimia sp.]